MILWWSNLLSYAFHCLESGVETFYTNWHLLKIHVDHIYIDRDDIHEKYQTRFSSSCCVSYRNKIYCNIKLEKKDSIQIQHDAMTNFLLEFLIDEKVENLTDHKPVNAHWLGHCIFRNLIEWIACMWKIQGGVQKLN